ncbi:MAG: hypothetical protein CMP65_06210 [Flavobacteriales bacterium]|nr:hypothetical protein [Flavobacteriales bacterium]|tara:strand:+ start:4629 stop:5981 length:1353 start_codon:yes stop_codon:yes gene_type:complete
MYHSKIILIQILFFLLFIGCKNDQLTFNEDIAPIVHKKCSICHHDGGAGPFELINYQDFKKRIDMIEFVIQKNYMPPWPADPNYRHFAQEKCLKKLDKEKILNWIKYGAVEGDSTINFPTITKENISAKPDLIVSLDNEFITNGENKDQFLMMKFPFELKKDTFIRKIEFIPDNRQIVHHVNAHLITYENDNKQNIFGGDKIVDTELFSDKEAFEKLDILNDQDQYPRLTPSVSNYLPGSEQFDYPKGIGVIKANKKNVILVNDFHYAPSPYKEKDQSYFKIYFSEIPPKRVIRETQLGTFGISDIIPPLIIPANEIKKFTTKAIITDDISILTINPHMHLLGKTFLAFAVTLQDDTIPLIKIDNWNFRWQYFYTFKKMLKIPAGSEIIVEATYDNTSKNPDNPFNPPQLISERKNFNGRGSMKTSNEMLQFIINYLEYQEGDENIILGN